MATETRTVLDGDERYEAGYADACAATNELLISMEYDLEGYRQQIARLREQLAPTPAAAPPAAGA